MAGKAPAFQFYANDWLGSTNVMLMTPAQEGAYIRLLAIAWNAPDCGLPDDDEQLAALSRLGEGWFNGGSTILRKCFVCRDGRLYNSRLLAERKKQEEWRKKSRAGGKASAAKRLRRKNGSRVVEPPYQPKGNSSSSSTSSTSSTSKTPCSPPSELSAEQAAAMSHLTQPPPAQLGDAKRHMQNCYREAFNIDSNIAPVPNFPRWVERLMEAAGGYDAGLAHVRSFIPKDFLEANNAFFGRKNKAQTWSGTWVENAWTHRHGKAHEDKADADREKHRRESADVDARVRAVADKAAKDGREAARTEAAQIDAGWAKLSVSERQKWIQDNPPHVIFAKKAWWAERNKT